MSGLIQGADKWICLSPIPKVFLSVICTTEAWGKKKSLKSESEKPLQETERKLRGHSIQRQAHSWQTDRGFGHWHITAQLQQQQAFFSPPELRSSWAPQGQPFPLPCSCCSPHRAEAEGTRAVLWDVAAGDEPVSETGPFPGGQVTSQW